MLCRSRVALRVAGLLAALVTGCSERTGIEPGEAAEALTGAYCITNVQTDPFTYHFDSPAWVLDAAEGLGPRILALTIAGFAEPMVSTTLATRPKASDVSTAVGYSLGKFYFLQASAAHNVDTSQYRRLEAYTNYARSTWVIRDAGCNAVLGTGTSFKPIGVYFKVRDARSMAIDGSIVTGLVSGCGAGQCGYAPPDPPPPDPPPPADAGTGDGGGE